MLQRKQNLSYLHCYTEALRYDDISLYAYYTCLSDCIHITMFKIVQKMLRLFCFVLNCEKHFGSRRSLQQKSNVQCTCVQAVHLYIRLLCHGILAFTAHQRRTEKHGNSSISEYYATVHFSCDTFTHEESHASVYSVLQRVFIHGAMGFEPVVSMTSHEE